MFSWLKALWSGGSGRSGAASRTHEAVEYKGFRIRPAPFGANGRFQTAGVIEKDAGAETLRHEFIRADTHQTEDDAAAHAVSKGKQIIDERGDGVFRSR